MTVHADEFFKDGPVYRLLEPAIRVRSTGGVPTEPREETDGFRRLVAESHEAS
ncbi:hypothetical protein [Embleya sp. NPDC005575]|uniref:hypothetical protein n=1 Tax=Embleya sp. NPDC005575 TaxID=3156892 RepID=UPI0033A3FDC2